MSHFTTVKTKLRDVQCIKQALEDLGYEFVEAEAEQKVQVRGYQGQLTDADLCVKASKTYDIGLRLTNQGVEFLADWWGVETTKGVTEEEFINQLSQRYAYHKIMKEVKAQGFSIEMEEEEEQTIQLTVRKWL
ncbi:MAG: hypothetical protein CMH57_03955 [Myxococcales bacterium]|nr:hypothetical protein [Myxococcales bacterium]